jgi:hypothetical protein
MIEKGNPEYIAERWEKFCGDCSWTRYMRALEGTGCKVTWYDGYPRSRSAIPLCFVIYLPDGTEYKGHSRLKDIRNVVRLIQKGSTHNVTENDV